MCQLGFLERKVAFVIFLTSIMEIPFEIHQKVKGHFLGELRVFFKNFYFIEYSGRMLLDVEKWPNIL